MRGVYEFTPYEVVMMDCSISSPSANEPVACVFSSGPWSRNEREREPVAGYVDERAKGHEEEK